MESCMVRMRMWVWVWVWARVWVWVWMWVWVRVRVWARVRVRVRPYFFSEICRIASVREIGAEIFSGGSMEAEMKFHA